jgi:hypothetical protein
METTTLDGQYVLLLGSHPVLSRAELKPVSKELRFYARWNFVVAEDLVVHNPRNLPKKPEQLFLDRLGGVVRVAKVIGEFSDVLIAAKAAEELQKRNKDTVVNIGMSSFGLTRSQHQGIRDGIEHDLKTLWERKVRVVREASPLLSSGRIFNDKLLKKGGEVIIWPTENGYTLAVTKATQNLRNYTLRDRSKPFRDSKMGMLPPKVAQMLLNFSGAKEDDMVIDPFCGSGTVNSEAAIAGYDTEGSDINEKNIDGTQANFAFLAEKFRFDMGAGKFEVLDAAEIEYATKTGVIVTEGFLGENFEERPSSQGMDRSLGVVENLWRRMFEQLKESEIHTIVFCLPAMYQGERVKSIREKVFAKAKESAYTPIALFGNDFSYVYSREGAYVGREICVVTRR